MKKLFLLLSLFLVNTSISFAQDIKTSDSIKVLEIESSSNSNLVSNMIDNDAKTNFSFESTDIQKNIKLKFNRSEIDGISLWMSNTADISNIYLYDWVKLIKSINTISTRNLSDLKLWIWTEIILSWFTSYSSINITEVKVFGRQSKKLSVKQNIDVVFSEFFKKIENKDIYSQSQILAKVNKNLETTKNKITNSRQKEVFDYMIWIINEKVATITDDITALEQVKKIVNENY